MKQVRKYEIYLQSKASAAPNDFRTEEFQSCSSYREGMKEAKRLSALCPFKGSNGAEIVNIELVCEICDKDEWGGLWNFEAIFYEEFTNGQHIGRYAPGPDGTWRLHPVRKKALK